MLSDMNLNNPLTTQTETIYLSHHAKEAIRLFKDCPATLIDDLNNFKKLLEDWTTKASKETHYYRLNYWEKAVLQFIVPKLDSDPSLYSYMFWLNMYKTVNSIALSPHLKTNVKRHHSSAYERNQALLVELNSILNNI
jgi:hypothetical protein